MPSSITERLMTLSAATVILGSERPFVAQITISYFRERTCPHCIVRLFKQLIDFNQRISVMVLNRRQAMELACGTLAATALPGMAMANFAPRPAGWRSFEIQTQINMTLNGSMTQAWVPVPSITEGDWMRAGATTWTGNADHISLKFDGKGTRFVHAIWLEKKGVATLDVMSSASARNRLVNLDGLGLAKPLSAEERMRFTAPTDLIPIDGIVRDTAESIIKGATNDVEKARRIYDWIVDSTERNPETRGCGLGDIASMLTMGDLTGKCADLNSLYVGLARSVGLPARDVYGLRVAPSEFGYKSLGAGSPDVTKAQHCRADVFLEGFGWTPVDPADVRKVVLEEPPKTLTLQDAKVQDVRSALFGAWEGNWIAYNFTHDVVLPEAPRSRIPFLMYPQAANGEKWLDELDPENFAYSINARETSG
jgi:transglutaminase-like putative cysteine protease